MPRGTPRLGQSVVDDLANRPQAEVLGEVSVKGPAMQTWDDPELKAQIALEEGPPPWEQMGGPNGSDARQFLKCPDDWVLYWINQKLLDIEGWRGWRAVKPSDPRVKVHVASMVTPEGMVRRGGPNGDILAYMPRHWYEARKAEQKARTQKQTESSMTRMENLKEEFKRGSLGGGMISIDSARHPTHTMADLTGAND